MAYLCTVPPETDPPAERRVPAGSATRSASIAEAAEVFHEAVFDLDVLLHIVAERISRATGDYCSVGLVSTDGQRFQPLVAYHPDPALIEDSRQFLGVSMDIDAAGPWGADRDERGGPRRRGRQSQAARDPRRRASGECRRPR